MLHKHKPYYYIDAYIDVSPYLPTTPETDFEFIFYFNHDNSLAYLSETNTETTHFYRIPNNTAVITDVEVSSNPPINRLYYTENVSFTNIQVILTNTFYPYNAPPEIFAGTLKTSNHGTIFGPSDQFAIDSLGQYLYIGSGVYPGVIFRYNLDKFTKAGTLGLTGNQAFGNVIDPTNTFLYSIGSDGGYLRKIQISTFSQVAAISLPGNLLVIHPNGSYLYACRWERGLARLNLSTFSADAYINQSNVDYNATMIITPNGQHLYTGSGNGYINKYTTSPFQEVASINVAGRIYSSVMHPNGNFAYFTTLTSGVGSVIKLDLSTFTVVSTYTLTSGYSRAIAIKPSGDFLYVGTYENPARIITLNSSTLFETRVVTGVTLDKQMLFWGAIADPVNPYVYFGAYQGAWDLGWVAVRYNYSVTDDILISGLSGYNPGNLQNRIEQTDVDYKSQIVKRTDNSIPGNNCYIALYVKGKTGGKTNNDPEAIHTRLKVYPFA
jgi:hypothetical protein